MTLPPAEEVLEIYKKHGIEPVAGLTRHLRDTDGIPKLCFVGALFYEISGGKNVPEESARNLVGLAIERTVAALYEVSEEDVIFAEAEFDGWIGARKALPSGSWTDVEVPYGGQVALTVSEWWLERDIDDEVQSAAPVPELTELTPA